MESADLTTGTPGIRKYKDAQSELQVNMGYCCAYAILGGIGTWQCAFALSGNANTTPIF